MEKKNILISIIVVIAIACAIYFTYYSSLPITGLVINGIVAEDKIELQDSLRYNLAEEEVLDELYDEDIEDYSYDDYPHLTGFHWGKMPVKYFIMNPERCGAKIVEQIRTAFGTIQNKTDGIVTFEEGFIEDGISIECFHRYGEDISTGMQASSTYTSADIVYVFDDEVGNVISNGEIKLYKITLGKYYGRCGSEPVTIISGILNTFGFENNGDSDSIMYRYVGNCDTEIDEKIIKKLKEDYAPQIQ